MCIIEAMLTERDFDRNVTTDGRQREVETGVVNGYIWYSIHCDCGEWMKDATLTCPKCGAEYRFPPDMPYSYAAERVVGRG